MKKILISTVSLIFAITLIAAIAYGCSGWHTRYSTANETGGHVFLDKDGKLIFGPCGFGRQKDASYSIELIGPGPEYNGDKYKISGPGVAADSPLIGSINVKDNKITLKLFWRNGDNFDGNGTYKINADG